MIVKRWSERENLGSRAPGLVSSFWEKKHPDRAERGRSPTPISESLLGQAQRGKYRGQSRRWSLVHGCGGGGGNSQDRSSGH